MNNVIIELINYYNENWINIWIIVLVLFIITIFTVLENISKNEKNNNNDNGNKDINREKNGLKKLDSQLRNLYNSNDNSIGNDNGKINENNENFSRILENFENVKSIEKKIKFTNEEQKHSRLLNKMKKGFCTVNEGSSDTLESDCNSLTKDTCNMTECCIYAYNSDNPDGKCIAGSKSGAMYQSDENGSLIDYDYYYYMNKCYGNKCPNLKEN